MTIQLSPLTIKLLAVLTHGVKTVTVGRIDYAILTDTEASLQPELGGFPSFAIPARDLEQWAASDKPDFDELLEHRVDGTKELAIVAAREAKKRLTDLADNPILTDGQFVLYSTDPHEALSEIAAAELACEWGIIGLPANDHGKPWTQVSMRPLAKFEERFPATVVTHRVTITHDAMGDSPSAAPEVEVVSQTEPAPPDDAEVIGRSIDMSSQVDPRITGAGLGLGTLLTVEEIDSRIRDAGLDAGAVWNVLAGGGRTMAPEDIVTQAIEAVKAATDGLAG